MKYDERMNGKNKMKEHVTKEKNIYLKNLRRSLLQNLKTNHKLMECEIAPFISAKKCSYLVDN